MHLWSSQSIQAGEAQFRADIEAEEESYLRTDWALPYRRGLEGGAGAVADLTDEFFCETPHFGGFAAEEGEKGYAHPITVTGNPTLADFVEGQVVFDHELTRTAKTLADRPGQGLSVKVSTYTNLGKSPESSDSGPSTSRVFSSIAEGYRALILENSRISRATVRSSATAVTKPYTPRVGHLSSPSRAVPMKGRRPPQIPRTGTLVAERRYPCSTAVKVWPTQTALSPPPYGALLDQPTQHQGQALAYAARLRVLFGAPATARPRQTLRLGSTIRALHLIDSWCAECAAETVPRKRNISAQWLGG